jgi:hypothetical protein
MEYNPKVYASVNFSQQHFITVWCPDTWSAKLCVKEMQLLERGVWILEV